MFFVSFIPIQVFHALCTLHRFYSIRIYEYIKPRVYFDAKHILRLVYRIYVSYFVHDVSKLFRRQT